MVMQVLDSPYLTRRDTSSVRGISYGGAPGPARPGAPAGPSTFREPAGQRLRAHRDLGGDHHERRCRLRAPSPTAWAHRCRCATWWWCPRTSGARSPPWTCRPGPEVTGGAVGEGSPGGARLLEPARGHRPRFHPGLAPHRRRRPHRRRGVRSASSTGPRTSSSGAARTSTRWRSKRCCTSTRRWPTARSSASRTRCWARRWAR